MTTPRPNRIIDHLVVKGRDLLPNPANWRTHPPQQRAATRAALDPRETASDHAPGPLHPS